MYVITARDVGRPTGNPLIGKACLPLHLFTSKTGRYFTFSLTDLSVNENCY